LIQKGRQVKNVSVVSTLSGPVAMSTQYSRQHRERCFPSPWKVWWK